MWYILHYINVVIKVWAIPYFRPIAQVEISAHCKALRCPGHSWKRRLTPSWGNTGVRRKSEQTGSIKFLRRRGFVTWCKGANFCFLIFFVTCPDSKSRTLLRVSLGGEASSFKLIYCLLSGKVYKGYVTQLRQCDRQYIVSKYNSYCKANSIIWNMGGTINDAHWH